MDYWTLRWFSGTYCDIKNYQVRCVGSGGHNVPIILDDNGPRKLTPRECFRLQGFPDDYNLNGISDSKLYKLAGNAVTLSVVKLIADKLI